MNAPNAVDIDPAAIAAELQQLEPALPGEGAPAGGEVASPGTAVDWSKVMAGSMQMLSLVVAPNWDLSEDEQSVIATQGAAVLQAFWPNAVIEEKWLVLCVFLISTGGIVMQRYDDDDASFKPLRKPKPAKVAKPEPAEAAVASKPVGDGAAAAAAAPAPSRVPKVAATPLASVPG